MSKIEVNQISSQCGSTLTIGQSGDTVTLACGATQTGFGRTGTVDWDTTAKTAGFTAVSGNGYFVNTTSGAITVTLPAGSAGSIVSLKDYANTWDTNNVTVTPNGTDKINGINGNAVLNTQDQSVTLVYVDSTKGWRAVQDSTSTVDGAKFITATGGTVITCGNYKIHTFTAPGTFTVSCAGNAGGSNTVDYMVIAGGGGGGANYGGGGGAGGFRESSGAASGCYTVSPLGACVSALPVTATGYPITVGGGGAGLIPPGGGSSGSNSVFSTITSTGGGGGGGADGSCAALSGGSGGGGSGGGPGGQSSAGSGNTPPVSPPQGQNGMNGSGPSTTGFAGGGGGAGQGGCTTQCGGDGVGTAITTSTCYGTPGPTPAIRYYAGGGGGRSSPPTADGEGGVGGGGGPSSPPSGGDSLPGTINTGSGGMGAISGAGSGSGGSGIVIIRYKYQ